MIFEELRCCDKVLKTSQRLFYKKGEIIYRQDELCTRSFYFLVKGLIKISCKNNLNEKVILDIVSPHNTFGEQALDGAFYFSTAEAYVDSVVYRLCAKEVYNMMNISDSFRKFMYDNLRDKLKLLSTRLVMQSLSAEKILASALIELLSKIGRNPLPLLQKDLCQYTRLNRTTIYHILKDWQHSLVRVHHGKIFIVDVMKLKEISST